MPPKIKRRRLKLINKAIQLRVVYYIFAVAFVVVMLHSWFTTYLIRSAVGHDVRLNVGWLLFLDIMVALLITVIFSFALGVLGTHRFAGPLYRFQQTLKQVAKGDISPRIYLRKGDLLQEFCEDLNLALANVRDFVTQDRRLLYEVTAKIGVLREALHPENRKGVDEILRQLEKITSKFTVEPPEVLAEAETKPQHPLH